MIYLIVQKRIHKDAHQSQGAMNEESKNFKKEKILFSSTKQKL